MTTLTLTSTTPETEARALVAALQEWLKEQPEHPMMASKANFYYNGRGFLSSVTVVFPEAD